MVRGRYTLVNAAERLRARAVRVHSDVYECNLAFIYARNMDAEARLTGQAVHALVVAYGKIARERDPVRRVGSRGRAVRPEHRGHPRPVLAQRVVLAHVRVRDDAGGEREARVPRCREVRALRAVDDGVVLRRARGGVAGEPRVGVRADGGALFRRGGGAREVLRVDAAAVWRDGPLAGGRERKRGEMHTRRRSRARGRR